LGFDLYISQIVIQGSNAGDENAAERRPRILKDIPLLDIVDKVAGLAADLIKQVLPPCNFKISLESFTIFKP
jgi:hypothetical protein